MPDSAQATYNKEMRRPWKRKSICCFVLTTSVVAFAELDDPKDIRYARYTRGITLMLQLNNFMAKGNKIESEEDIKKLQDTVKELNAIIDEAKQNTPASNEAAVKKMKESTEKYSKVLRAISDLPNEYFYENGARERFIEFHNNATNLLTVLSFQVKNPDGTLRKYSDRTLENLKNNLSSLLRDAPGYPSALELYVMPAGKSKRNFSKEFVESYSTANEVDRLKMDAEVANKNPGLVKKFYVDAANKDLPSPDLPGTEALRHFLKDFDSVDFSQIVAKRIKDKNDQGIEEAFAGNVLKDNLKKAGFITLYKPVDGSGEVDFRVGSSNETYRMKLEHFKEIVYPQALGYEGRLAVESAERIAKEKALPLELPVANGHYVLSLTMQEFSEVKKGSMLVYKAMNEKGELRFEYTDYKGEKHSIFVDKAGWFLYMDPVKADVQKVIDSLKEPGFRSVSSEDMRNKKYSVHSVKLTKDVPGIGLKGDVFWAPWVDDGDDSKAQIFRITKDLEESFVVKEDALESFYNLSELKQDIKDSVSGKTIAKKGEQIYELYHDSQNVTFSVVDDEENTLRNMDIETYKRVTKSLKSGYQIPDSKDDDPKDPDIEKLEDSRIVEEPIAPAQHAEFPTFKKPEKGFVEPNIKKDCEPKGGRFAKYYKQKPEVPYAERAKYKKYIIEAANATGIAPAIIEASLQIESDFQEDKINSAERKAVRIDKGFDSNEKAELYAWNKQLSVIGKSMAQIGPAEARAMEYKWLGSYEENKNKKDHIWNPKNAIMAKARLMRMKMDQDAKRRAAARGLDKDQAVAYMMNRGGEIGLAEQARYILSLFNRGIRAVNSLDLFIDQHDGKWPRYYGQVWSETPKNASPGYLYRQHINRGHVYRGAGLCGPLPKDSLVARYQKEYEQIQSPEGLVWVVKKGLKTNDSI